MELRIQFTDQRISSSNLPATVGAGAVVEFLGIVRGLERDETISGLIYEIYEAMAERMVRRIVEELNARYPCLAFQLAHRHGFVPVGEAAIYVRVESSHRTEAIRMLEHFMNRLKSDVPIWKSGSVPC